MKIRPMGTEFFHADRRTDSLFFFRKFANAPKKLYTENRKFIECETSSEDSHKVGA